MQERHYSKWNPHLVFAFADTAAFTKGYPEDRKNPCSTAHRGADWELSCLWGCHGLHGLHWCWSLVISSWPFSNERAYSEGQESQVLKYSHIPVSCLNSISPSLSHLLSWTFLTSEGAWVAELVQHPTLDLSPSHDLRIVGLRPALGSYSVQSLFGILSSSHFLSLCSNLLPNSSCSLFLDK